MEPAVALLERAANVAVGMCTRVHDRQDRREAILACQYVAGPGEGRPSPPHRRRHREQGLVWDRVSGHGRLVGRDHEEFVRRRETEREAGLRVGQVEGPLRRRRRRVDHPRRRRSTRRCGEQTAAERNGHDIADLVDAAKGASPKDAKDAAGRWKEILASETEEDAAARRFGQRAVHTTVPVEGMGTLSVTLPTLQYREFLAVDQSCCRPSP